MRISALLPFAGAVVIVSSLTGCATKPCRERGWIGGDVKCVAANRGCLHEPAPACDNWAVTGMPKSASARSGLLVLKAPASSPLAQAGVLPGDLLVSLDGKPLYDPLTFRCAIEARKPGSPAVLEVWRDGAEAPHPIIVGRERYKRENTISIRIPIDPHVDLYPFDGDVSVFGLVVAESHPSRNDIATVERCYLAKAVPGKTPAEPIQERTEVGVFPLYLGAQTRVLAQETVVPAQGGVHRARE